MFNIIIQVSNLKVIIFDFLYFPNCKSFNKKYEKNIKNVSTKLVN